MVDLVKMKALIWNGEELGASWDEVDIPADLVDQANEYREKLIDSVVELDDQVRRVFRWIWPRVLGLWVGIGDIPADLVDQGTSTGRS
jgi:hypothetical protein